MSHLMSSLQNIAQDETIHRVGVGSLVVYCARSGSMRQGRTEFPAIVLGQNPDDGSLELLVIFEPEDQLWERRVLPYSEQQPGHCWKPVTDRPFDTEEMTFDEQIGALRAQIFADFEAPPKSVMEYLSDFDNRLRAMESTVLTLQGLVLNNPGKAPKKGK